MTPQCLLDSAYSMMRNIPIAFTGVFLSLCEEER